MRWNLKEGVGKSLVRRTETIYKAGRGGKAAKHVKAQKLHGTTDSRYGRALKKKKAEYMERKNV